MPRDSLKINLFTAGDSSDLSTWSNVPYFLSKSLIEHGVDLRRVNLIPEDSVLYRAYRVANYKYDGLSKRLLGKRRPMDLFHDRIARALIQRKVRGTADQFDDADFNFFLTYSFSSRPRVATPTIHFSDVCLQHALEDQQRPVGPRHRRMIEEEKTNLSRASLVLGTNEPCCAFLREHYGVAGARRLPGGINLDWQAPDDLAAYLGSKWRARHILFIGVGIRRRGVDILLEAFEQFNQGRDKPYRLSLVGIHADELGQLPPNVRCLGYLNKSDPADMARYIGLLESATMFVMPMREGPPTGVVKEALLTATPVIHSNIWNADSKVRHDHCGRLVDQIEPGAFANEMTRLASDRERWNTMAINATEHAQQWSWHNSVGELVEELHRRRDGGQA